MTDHLLQTERLDLRPPTEDDRERFVGLFGDEEFMVFSDGVLDVEAANLRFDIMVQNAEEIPFAKQPVIVRSSGQIVGYSGVAWFEFEGRRRLEFGYRFVPEARGLGYATEAGQAILDLAAESYEGELIALIDPENARSQRVAAKLGFEFWKLATVNGFLDGLHRLQISRG